MAQNQVTMRFQRPRDLEANETADSLEHWKNQLEVYLKRDPTLSMFLEETWNTNEEFYALEAREGVTQEQMMANCKIFLGHICSFFKYPYYNHLIKERSTDLASIYSILSDIYNIETNLTSFMSIAKVTKSKSESYAVFYQKIVYLVQQNLAPAGKVVQYIPTPAEGDKLSVSLLDHAALLWLLKIDPRLPDRIDLDYAIQIKEGARLSELVPQIAKNMPNILKRLDGVKTEVLNCISGLTLDEQDEEEVEEGELESVNVRFNRGGSRGLGRRGQRGGSRGNFRGNSRNDNPRNQDKPLCRHCNWLRTFWKISEVDPYHKIENCQRYIPASVKAIIENEISEGDLDDDEQADPGKKIVTIPTHPQVLHFQSSHVHEEDQPTRGRAQDRKIIPSSVANLQSLRDYLLSEDTAARLKIRAVRLLRKASSPRLLVTFNNKRVTLLIDEGSKINCLDGDFAEENKIRLEPSSNSARAAGNKELSILGQSVDDVYVDTKFQSHRISVNLGKVTVIRNLRAQ